MQQPPPDEVETFTDLWRAAYLAGFSDAVLRRECDPFGCLPDDLPIAHLPSAVTAVPAVEPVPSGVRRWL